MTQEESRDLLAELRRFLWDAGANFNGPSAARIGLLCMQSFSTPADTFYGQAVIPFRELRRVRCKTKTENCSTS